MRRKRWNGESTRLHRAMEYAHVACWQSHAFDKCTARPHVKCIGVHQCAALGVEHARSLAESFEQRWRRHVGSSDAQITQTRQHVAGKRSVCQQRIATGVEFAQVRQRSPRVQSNLIGQRFVFSAPVCDLAQNELLEQRQTSNRDQGVGRNTALESKRSSAKRKKKPLIQIAPFKNQSKRIQSNLNRQKYILSHPYSNSVLPLKCRAV